jgi:hypothetical protein
MGLVLSGATPLGNMSQIHASCRVFLEMVNRIKLPYRAMDLL